MKEMTGEKRKTEEKSSPDGSINFIHHFSPSKKITDEQIHLSLPHRNMKLVPVTYFFRFSSFSLVRSLWLPQCASIVFMQWTFFAAHQVNENQSTGPAFPRRSHWEKNITSFRAAKNPLLWRHNDLKFNLFCVHLYEKSTMIHLK